MSVCVFMCLHASLYVYSRVCAVTVSNFQTREEYEMKPDPTYQLFYCITHSKLNVSIRFSLSSTILLISSTWLFHARILYLFNAIALTLMALYVF